jgi:RNA polymerase sigma-70 factor (ECF subfamily)
MMDDPCTTRASLLHALTNHPGDDHAWDEFVRIYSSAILGWCRARGLQAADAEDVAQTVLVRFWRQSARFDYDPARRFRHYLKRIVTTALADWHADAPDTALQSDSEAVAAVVSSVPAREELIARIEQAYDGERLRIVMAEVEGRVQPHTWEAFRLLALEHLSGRAVADRLGIEINTAYRARSKVLRMIRAALAQIDDGVDPPASAPPAG